MTRDTDTSLIDSAITILSSIERWHKAIHKINADISELDPSDDFAPALAVMPASLEKEVVGLLDGVLGDEVASYYLYEAKSMKGGGKIIETDGIEYPIRHVADVRKYVMRSKS